ncbi:MAG: TIGR03435 family protein [Acidobacteriota bacterium]
MSIKLGRTALVLMLSGIGAWAQTAPTVRPTFEVAVIKPIELANLIASRGTLGLEVTAQRVTANGPLLALIQIAYGVNFQQLEGPDWLLHPKTKEDLRMFNIEAKLPEGAASAQVLPMLQNLLEDRFKLTVRRGSKQLDGYALMLGKDGPKFQKKEPSADQQDAFAKLNQGAGPGVAVITGGAKTTLGPGNTRIEASSPAGLAEGLSASNLRLGQVVDKTGLQGTFDIKLEIPPADGTEQRDRIFVALATLGLKLEMGKNAVETIIIEHAEKAPTEN